MVFALLLTIVVINILGFIYVGSKFINVDIKSNEIKGSVSNLNDTIIFAGVLEAKNEEDIKKAVLLSNSLSNQMGTMKSYYEKELKSLSYMYDNELHKLSRSIEYKENEIQHLRSIIDVVKNHNLERKQGYPSSAHSRDESEATTDSNSEYDNDSKGEAYNGERDGLRFQDEALLVYEGGVWEDDEHSEMGHDGDDY